MKKILKILVSLVRVAIAFVLVLPAVVRLVWVRWQLERKIRQRDAYIQRYLFQ